MALIGANGMSVVLSAETAYYLERICKVASLRQRLRDGRHPLVSQELLELRTAAMSFDPSQLPQGAEVGSGFAEVATGLEHGQWLTVREAADLLWIGERAVRLACKEGRLVAEREGSGPWRISREAVREFKAARAA